MLIQTQYNYSFFTVLYLCKDAVKNTEFIRRKFNENLALINLIYNTSVKDPHCFFTDPEPSIHVMDPDPEKSFKCGRIRIRNHNLLCNSFQIDAKWSYSIKDK